nr:hypothetical protein CFP56_04210 [Quercus suber]
MVELKEMAYKIKEDGVVLRNAEPSAGRIKLDRQPRAAGTRFGGRILDWSRAGSEGVRRREKPGEVGVSVH